MDEPIVKLSLEDWSYEQRVAIARLAAQALTETAPLLGEAWCEQWWHDMLQYLQVSQTDLESRIITCAQAVELLTCETRDIRIEVMMDLLALALHITPTAMKEDTRKSQAKHVMLYDARSKRFLVQLEKCLKLTRGDLGSVEKSIAQQMYYSLLEQQGEQGNTKESMDTSARKAMVESNKKKQALKWLATGAGVIGGGAVIALTGGLAAPLLGSLLAGAGMSFFATAGGVALVTSLFGLTGGGLAGWKMHKRIKGVEQFEFKQILHDPDLPPVPALHCTICISGFLLDSKDETRTPWETAFEKNRLHDEIFCLEYETDELLNLGYSFKKFVRDSAVRYAGMEVAKQTVLKAFFAAVSLPATILKMADVIDNPWQVVTNRSRTAGSLLADILQERVQGSRPCSLVSYSCGSLVIWYCLLELKKRGLHGLVDHVVLMGAPISTEETDEWEKALDVVSGRFINCYTEKDWVLAFVYRLHSLATNVAGLEPVEIGDRIENIKVDIDGHTKYPDAVKEIMDQIRLE
ncbi:uncharacterized protein B0P05DRAFT_575912 [Gilbertella persicaria]|uniref:uncharacterized protein n=1 Tax=Gilbertella persicaria TaxID=101096 RepID=UPI00221EEE75|nr:uncharacterized protein B0P05DRAFT_575912 [Gilbertella persicaria]KAI8049136.1 hypothetical protein B0P05DRAFT_575912 [Gilbertella persicaria]